jgi:S-adenosylmethionine decarboxylase
MSVDLIAEEKRPAADLAACVSEFDEMFFEGPEKLLEIWFVDPDNPDPPDKKDAKKAVGLRSIPIEVIKEMLDLVYCQILHKTSNNFFDAYVLSESSLFVHPRKIILKTCGTTTLLRAVPFILEMAKKYCGFTVIGDVFYSRRNFFYEFKQKEPHGSFQDEVKFLDKIFDGSAYILGKKNAEHWYLYLTDKGDFHNNSAQYAPSPLPTISLAAVKNPQPDFTLEVLMTELDRDIMRQFYKKEGVTVEDVTKSSGIASLIPGAIIDAYLFDPCGYSMNGLLDDGYYTIHITPQPKYSYVSFETNIHCDFTVLLGRVLQVFRPHNFTVTLFAGNLPHKKVTEILVSLFACEALKKYVRRTKIRHEFENNYELAFGHYESAIKPLEIHMGKRKELDVSSPTSLSPSSRPLDSPPSSVLPPPPSSSSSSPPPSGPPPVPASSSLPSIPSSAPGFGLSSPSSSGSPARCLSSEEDHIGPSSPKKMKLDHHFSEISPAPT